MSQEKKYSSNNQNQDNVETIKSNSSSRSYDSRERSSKKRSHRSSRSRSSRSSDRDPYSDRNYSSRYSDNYRKDRENERKRKNSSKYYDRNSRRRSKGTYSSDSSDSPNESIKYSSRNKKHRNNESQSSHQRNHHNRRSKSNQRNRYYSSSTGSSNSSSRSPDFGKNRNRQNSEHNANTQTTQQLVQQQILNKTIESLKNPNQFPNTLNQGGLGISNPMAIPNSVPISLPQSLQTTSAITPRNLTNLTATLPIALPNNQINSTTNLTTATIPPTKTALDPEIAKQLEEITKRIQANSQNRMLNSTTTMTRPIITPKLTTNNVQQGISTPTLLNFGSNTTKSASSGISQPVNLTNLLNPNRTLTPVQPQDDTELKLYVGNIPMGLLPITLKNYINQAMVIKKLSTDLSSVIKATVHNDKPYGFVWFKDKETTTKATQLDGIQMGNHLIKINRPTKWYQLHPEKKPNELLNQEKIFVGGLPAQIAEKQLVQLLTQYGELKSFLLIKDPMTGESKGYAFCEYVDPKVTDKVCNVLNGSLLFDKKITVQRAVVGAKKDVESLNSEKSVSLMTKIGSVINQVQNFDLIQNYSIIKTIIRPPLYQDLSPEKTLHLMIPLGLGTIKKDPKEIDGVTPTKVVILYNIISDDILEFEEPWKKVIEEIYRHCKLYGRVQEILSPRIMNNNNHNENIENNDNIKLEDNKKNIKIEFGKIYVKFMTLDESVNASNHLCGQIYNTRTCVVAFCDETKYEELSEKHKDCLFSYKVEENSMALMLKSKKNEQRNRLDFNQLNNQSNINTLNNNNISNSLNIQIPQLNNSFRKPNNLSNNPISNIQLSNNNNLNDNRNVSNMIISGTDNNQNNNFNVPMNRLPSNQQPNQQTIQSINHSFNQTTTQTMPQTTPQSMPQTMNQQIHQQPNKLNNQILTNQNQSIQPNLYQNQNQNQNSYQNETQTQIQIQNQIQTQTQIQPKNDNNFIKNFEKSPKKERMLGQWDEESDED
ncbi:splicing factor u2af 65 kda subunit [Anaeramoeba flamelloides]|uniref:Splicing factor u2af 65 kDa subunit n=1 Tax=Anaeramoeba flamelloides TaxID=1746091 RepID=A0ABQ8Z4M6_9EUKA|nr:splicing factor u2af 65 kda subunit [Anaeramoeba flamelloides]